MTSHKPSDSKVIIHWITSPIFTESGEYNIITAMAVIFSYHNRCWARPKQCRTGGCSTIGESRPEIYMDEGREASPFIPSMDKGQVASLLSLLWTKDEWLVSSYPFYGRPLWTNMELGHF